ncbi:methyltransferase domain-containing protein [Candidatus Parcubacteria bacterium]|nr:methyltransferase domain-containing protein [Candidatus Parcubacteria bacterium]
MDWEFMTKEDLLLHLEENSKVFKNEAIRKAFEAVDRKDFIQPDYQIEAYEDYPLPTMSGQTISQPTTVAFMLELLDPQKGDNVLDVGSGTGWTTALLGHMVGKTGKVTGLEIRPELVEFGKENLKKYKELPVEIRQADNETGFFRDGPYNRILAGAAFPNKTNEAMELVFQLAPGGVMVAPIGESITKFERVNEDEYYETEYPGFIFVPYVQKFNLES